MMIRIIRKLPTLGTTRFSRKLHSSCMRRGYDHDGKTSVTIFNKNSIYGLLINSYSKQGFRLNNDVFVFGSMIIFPKTLLSWNITSMKDLSDDALSLFRLIEPKVDVLIIGYEDLKFQQDFTFLKNVKHLLKKNNINGEVLPIEKAIATYNFLVAENRFVAGAFIPPTELNILGQSNLVDRVGGEKFDQLCRVLGPE